MFMKGTTMKLIYKTIYSATLLYSLIIFSVTCDELQEDEHRTLVAKVNPDCSPILPSSCHDWTNQSLIHVRADGKHDSLHFIWSFDGSPSVLLARSHLQSNLTVNWTEYLAQHNNISNSTESFSPSLSLTSMPYYSFGWSLNNVWVFNDPGDTVYLDKVNQTEVKAYHTKDFKWERSINESSISDSTVKLTFVSTQYLNGDLGPEGHFKITITHHNTDGYSTILPYMIHNANNSQIDISFHDVKMEYPKPNFIAERIGFGFTIVQQKDNNSSQVETMRSEKIKSLDDEHTPGVFEMYRIRTPTMGPSHEESYLEWKPICYTASTRDITNSIDVHLYGLKNETTTFSSPFEAVKSSILMSYYGQTSFSEPHSDLLINYFNMSFGTNKDGFYNKTPHIAWTFLSGYGVPPNDVVSLLVILVLGVGLGVPALMIVVAGIYILVKRMSIQRDDLLLET